MSDPKHKRSERVADLIRAELMALIARGALRDPGLTNCYVTSVQMTDDLQNARVYVRALHEESRAHEKTALLAALTRATGFIRRELAPKLKLRQQPELRFFWDEGIDHAHKVQDLLASIAAEDSARRPDGEGQA